MISDSQSEDEELINHIPEPSIRMSVGFMLAYLFVCIVAGVIIIIGLGLAMALGADTEIVLGLLELFPLIFVFIFSIITAILGAKGLHPIETPYVFYFLMFLCSPVAAYFAGKLIARAVLRATEK